MALQDYQPYDIVYKKGGVLNTDADVLSRTEQVNAQDFSIWVITPALFRGLQKVDPIVKYICCLLWRSSQTLHLVERSSLSGRGQ